MATSDALQHDIAQLMQAIRAVEARRVQEAEDCARILQAQRQTIETLRKENKQLSEGLEGGSILSSQDAPSFSSLPGGMGQRYDQLMELADTYARKVEVERRQVADLETEVELAHAKLLEAQRAAGGHSGMKEKEMAPVRSVRMLEAKVAQAERRFNEALAGNKALAGQVEAAAKTRSALDTALCKAEKQLASLEGELQELRGAARLAGETRVAASAQAEALAVAEEQEEAAVGAELRELRGCVAADERLLQAQALRLEARVAAVSGEGEGHGGAGVGSDEASSSGGGGGEQEVLRQLMQAAALDSYEAAEAHYRTLEADSFALFCACNDANAVIGAAQKEVRQLETEIRQLEASSVMGKQRDAIAATLSKRDAAGRALDALRAKAMDLTRRLTMLRTGVLTTLKALGVTLSALPQQPTPAAVSTSGSEITPSGNETAPEPTTEPSVGAPGAEPSFGGPAGLSAAILPAAASQGQAESSQTAGAAPSAPAVVYGPGGRAGEVAEMWQPLLLGLADLEARARSILTVHGVATGKTPMPAGLGS